MHYPRLCKALSEISSGCSSAPAERPAQPAEHCWDRAAAAPPHRGLYLQPYNKAGGLQLFTACDRSPRAPSVPRTSEGHVQADPDTRAQPTTCTQQQCWLHTTNPAVQCKLVQRGERCLKKRHAEQLKLCSYCLQSAIMSFPCQLRDPAAPVPHCRVQHSSPQSPIIIKDDDH